MIRSFSVQNFQSVRESAHVSFELNGHAPDDGRTTLTASGLRLSKAIAVIGANASGKTTLIKALTFIDWFTKFSFQALKHDEPIPVDAHFLAPADASEFEYEFELDGKEWRYRLNLDQTRVYSESLHLKQSRAYSYVFVRNWSPQSKTYVVKQQGFGLSAKECSSVRENASLISTAAQFKTELALKLTQRLFLSNVDVLGRKRLSHDQIFQASQFYAQDEGLRQQMSGLLRDWDFGLSDVRLEKRSITASNGEATEIDFPFGIHRVGASEAKLTLFQESSGTQGAFLLLAKVLPALKYGGMVVIDELEADLHPHMLAPILDLYFSPNTNPLGAQIIFTCHSLEVLSLLHKSQVVLVEKDALAQSHAWRLDSVKGVRVDDNLYAKYMAGAYGAVPQL